MKALIISAISLLALASCSHHDHMAKIDSQPFDESKAEITQMLENKKTAVVSSQNCVKDATTKAALKVCLKNMHEMKKH